MEKLPKNWPKEINWPIDGLYQAQVVRSFVDKMHMELTWTPTAIELWNDKKFIEKRIEEQYFYAATLTSEQLSDRCTRSPERFDELIKAAQVVLERFQDRLKELNSDVSPHPDKMLKE